jgi:hypothetical protein
VRLRTWAIRVLSTGWTTPPDVDSDTWRLFLRAERCAVALSTRAEGDGPPILHALATVELQRILSAQAQIERLGQVAADVGLRVAVLKGGRHALMPGHAVNLDDVDVLAEPGEENTVAAFLDRTGYRTVSHTNEAHLGTRATADAVSVEVHFAVRELGPVADLWHDARPLKGHPGVWELAPVDHARHVLFHAVKTHAYRRSVLRDLLVIGEADARLDEPLRARFDRLVAGDSAHRALTRTLNQARTLRDGGNGDFFIADAAAHYCLLTPAVARLERRLGGQVSRRVFTLLDDRAARRAYWEHVWQGSPQSPWRFFEPLEDRSPGLARWVRRLLRLARAPVVDLFAAPIARRARRLAARYPSADSDARTSAIRSADA